MVYVLGPEEVAEYVIRYRSAGGFFGLSGLLMIVGLEELASLMAYLFPVVLIGALAWLSVYLYRAESPSAVDSLRVALMILLAIPAFGPGYGPQYVYWFLPLLVVYFHFTSRRVRRFILVGHAVVVATYLFEYAFFRSHGAFVLLFDESDVVMDFCRAVGLQESQTLIRLPLFVVYLGVIGGIVASLKESRHG
ncbi:MAG: hypothetical protein IH914_10525 [candidate division Zixibacteria bacterium]|nr:hypothetical protein [candidate division Zixibacteria bacterium]